MSFSRPCRSYLFLGRVGGRMIEHNSFLLALAGYGEGGKLGESEHGSTLRGARGEAGAPRPSRLYYTQKGNVPYCCTQARPRLSL